MTDILTQIKEHCAKAGESLTAFGWRAVRDRNLVRDIEAGRELRRATFQRVMDALDSERGAPQ